MDFISEDLARKLKEKGYPMEIVPIDNRSDKPNPILFALPYDHPEWQYCDAWYIPTIFQVLKWLRKKKIVVSILPTGYNKETGFPGYYYVIYDVAEYFWKKYEYPQSFEDWEECAIDSIKYVFDNLI